MNDFSIPEGYEQFGSMLNYVVGMPFKWVNTSKEWIDTDSGMFAHPNHCYLKLTLEMVEGDYAMWDDVYMHATMFDDSPELNFISFQSTNRNREIIHFPFPKHAWQLEQMIYNLTRGVDDLTLKRSLWHPSHPHQSGYYK
jgi:hypothetical protein